MLLSIVITSYQTICISLQRYSSIKVPRPVLAKISLSVMLSHYNMVAVVWWCLQQFGPECWHCWQRSRVQAWALQRTTITEPVIIVQPMWQTPWSQNQFCLMIGKECRNCGRSNHYEKMCRGAKGKPQKQGEAQGGQHSLGKKAKPKDKRKYQVHTVVQKMVPKGRVHPPNAVENSVL